jgi:uncharacterized protein YqeY
MHARFNETEAKETAMLKATIQADVKTAMKAGNAADRDALRLLLAEILTEEKKAGADLSDEQAAQVVNRVVKRTRGSIEEYGKLGATDTVAKLEVELAVYQRYAPEQLSESAVKAIVEGAVASVQATGPQDMGKVMKVLMPQVQGKADGQLVQRLVKEALNKN